VDDSTDEAPSFKLRIDAHALVQLGEQLITDDEQALLELVKNSYDADAEWARISVRSDYVPNEQDLAPPDAVGLIEIEDNGLGMDRAAITLGWLTISVSLKRDQKVRQERSPKFHRLPLGDKGLGRLGTMKLGKWLSIETRNSPTDQGWLVTFQWSEIQSGRPLEEVPIGWKRLPANGKTGSTVRILGLRDPAGWRQTRRLDRVKVKLSGLISPFEKFQHFDVVFTVDDREIDLQRITSSLRQTATVRFDYDWNGERLNLSSKFKLVWFRKKDAAAYDQFIARDSGSGLLATFDAKKALKRFVRSEDPAWFIGSTYEISKADLFAAAENDAVDPGSFSGSLDFFDLGTDTELPLGFLGTSGDYKDLVKILAQIYVYRDGFGVRMPNDWLRLGSAWTSQTGFYSLKPRNIIGFFQLSVERNPALVEKSDREGFTDNASWQGFLLLAEKIRDEANSALNKLGKGTAKYLKERAGSHASDEEAETNYGKIVTDLNELLEAAEQLRIATKEHAESRMNALHHLEGVARLITLDLTLPKDKREKAQQALARVERAEEEFAADIADIQSFTNQLSEQRQLAAIIRRRIDDFEERTQLLYDMVAVGLSAQALAHDVPAVLQHLEDQAKLAKRLLKARDPDLDALRGAAETMSGAVEAISQMINFVQPMLRGRRLSRRRAFLSKFVRDFLELRGSRLLSHGIRWHLETDGMRDFEIMFNAGRFTQVLDNLTTNSEYWISHKFGKDAQNGIITIELDDPELVFFDNGPGIRPDLEDSLFELFTTGKPREEGSGLGLFITRQLLLRDGCNISIDTVRNEEGRLYRFVVNFSGVRTAVK
jgi:signal transduction histidine kinase